MKTQHRELKAALIRLGIGHRELAEAYGVDRSLVGHVISGRRRHEPLESAIAERLGKPAEELFGPPPVKRSA